MKLYTKANCSICRARPLGCPYCDSEGLTYIEASDKLILEFIKQVDEDLKKQIYDKLKEEL